MENHNLIRTYPEMSLIKLDLLIRTSRTSFCHFSNPIHNRNPTSTMNPNRIRTLNIENDPSVKISSIET